MLHLRLPQFTEILLSHTSCFIIRKHYKWEAEKICFGVEKAKQHTRASRSFLFLLPMSHVAIVCSWMKNFKCHSGPIENHLYLHSLKSRKTLTFCFIEFKCQGNADAVLGDWNTFIRKNGCHLLTQRTITDRMPSDKKQIGILIIEKALWKKKSSLDLWDLNNLKLHLVQFEFFFREAKLNTFNLF